MSLVLDGDAQAQYNQILVLILQARDAPSIVADTTEFSTCILLQKIHLKQIAARWLQSGCRVACCTMAWLGARDSRRLQAHDRSGRG